MTDNERFEFAFGEIHALVMFAKTLARTHANQDLLRVHFEGAEQAGLAKIEPTLSTDALVEGFQFVCDEIRPFLKPSVEK